MRLLLLPLLLSSCAVAFVGDAADNCERYQAAQSSWMVACGLTLVSHGTECSAVMYFPSSSKVDSCIAEIQATQCGRPTPDPCGGLIVMRPW